MSITKEQKVELISTYSSNKNDTGSAEVQCAILTHRISALTEHLQESKKDKQAKKGLIALVVKRRRLLKYVAKKDQNRYQELIQKLGIRK